MNEGQKDVFVSLHGEFSPMVGQMCLGFMQGDRYLAKDLAQEVFINVWNSLSKFRGESSHKTWIYRITVNTCLLHMRREKGKQKVDVDMAAHLPQEVSSSAAIDDLYKAIGQLEEVERLIIMMMLDEVDQETISRIIGINLNNLRVKIYRIKGKLKYLLNYERGAE